MGLVPVDLRLMNRTIGKPYSSESLELSPPTLAVEFV